MSKNNRHLPAHLRPKKKGHQPAHLNQNFGAFHHNPKSKKTDHILSLPNENVCQKCYDKIEWRKTYRKYKPLSQPTKCNLCLQKYAVKAAYHTICVPCTKSEKAIARVWKHKGEHQPKEEPKKQPSTTPRNEEPEHEQENDDKQENEQEVDGKAIEQRQEEEEQDDEEEKIDIKKCRACAICVKEFALPNEDDEDSDDDKLNGVKLTLRQKKSLERQKLKKLEQKKKKVTNKVEQQGGEQQQPHEDSEEESEEDDEQEQGQHEELHGNQEEGIEQKVVVEGKTNSNGDDDDENDPFLKAVGGADKLLVGEAYQKYLLEQHKQQENK